MSGKEMDRLKWKCEKARSFLYCTQEEIKLGGMEFASY